MSVPNTYTQDDVLAVIRKETDATSIRKTALRIGVSATYLSDVLMGDRAVSETLAETFGFTREIRTEVVFHKKAA